MTKPKREYPLINPDAFVLAGWVSLILTLVAGVIFSAEPIGTGGEPFVTALSMLTMSCFLTALYAQRNRHK